MADPTSEDFHTLAGAIDRLYTRFTGVDPNRDTDRSSKTTKQRFDASLKKTTEGFELMHGSATHASYALRSLVGYAAFGTAVKSLIDGLTNMTQTFTKLSDVGLMFGGNIFEMQKLAGDSGLTLEQFAHQISKSSVVVAQMGTSQVKGVEQFNKYQVGIRNNLREAGYFGMSLSELTDRSAEYAEVLQTIGGWQQRTDEERRQATVGFITNISGLVAATGKSREAIIKQTTDAMKTPAVAAALTHMTKDQQANAGKYLSAMIAVSGELGGKAFKDLIAQDGRSWATDFGQAMNATGLGVINTVNERLRLQMLANEDVGEEFYTSQKRMADMIDAQHSSLAARYAKGENRAGIDQAWAFANEWRDKDPLKMHREHLAGQTPKMLEATKALGLFETNLHLVTGAFRKGFYDGLIKNMVDGAGGVKNFEDNLKKLGEVVGDFGKSLGIFVGWATIGVPLLVIGFDKLVMAIKGVHDGFEWLLGLLGASKEKAGAFAGLGAMGLGVGLIVYLKNLFKRFMHIETQVVNIHTRGIGGAGAAAVGAGGVGGAGGAAAVGGAGGAGAAAGKGRLARMFGAGSAFRRIGGGIAGLATGFIASSILNAAMEKVGDFQGKEELTALLDVGLITSLTIWGPRLAMGIITGISTVLGGAITAALAALTATYFTDAANKGELDKKAKEAGFTKEGGSLWNPFNKMPTYTNSQGEKLGFNEMQQRLHMGDYAPGGYLANSTAPANDNRSNQALQRRLVELEEIRVADTAKIANGDNSKIGELLDAIREQTRIQVVIAKRASDQAEESERREDNRQMYNR